MSTSHDLGRGTNRPVQQVLMVEDASVMGIVADG
jgi:hypothetical protein